MKGAKRINNILRSKIEFPLRTYFSSSRKGFPSYISPDGTFPKIWSIVPDTSSPIAQPKVIALEHLPHRSKAITLRKVLPDSQPIL